MRALALSFVEPRRLEWSEIELPSLVDGAVLARTLYSGISAGTELRAYRGELDPALPVDETIGALGGTFSYPFRFGYSCVGVVERSMGEPQPGSVVFAFHPHQTAFVVANHDAVAVDGVDPRIATLFPLVETALQVALDAGDVSDRAVIVVGLGVVGTLVGALLGRAGARVIGCEPLAWRRTIAAAFDVDALEPAALADRVATVTEGRGVPLVVEVSGNPAALADSLPLLAHEGTALVASWYGTAPVQLPLGAEFHRRRLSIRSTQVSTIPAALARDWTIERRRARARALLDELPLKLLATHEFDHREADTAFAALDEGRAGMMHVALRYG